jgi:hypothetical protein
VDGRGGATVGYSGVVSLGVTNAAEMMFYLTGVQVT